MPRFPLRRWSVGIRKTRHAVACGLIADLAGIIAAIFIAYIFFD
jgi:spore maturation protein SpmB